MKSELFTVVLSLLAYLCGSIPSGLLLGRALTGRDVRTIGSGNIGAANVSRLAGRSAAGLVLFFDLIKGALPVAVAVLLGLNPIQVAIVAGCAVVGHDFSLFLRFRGGKGVATTIGACAALAILPALAAGIVWLLIVALFRVSSLASLIALWLLPLFMAIFDERPEFVALSFALWLLGIFTHRDNLQRLSSRTENSVGRT